MEPHLVRFMHGRMVKHRHIFESNVLYRKQPEVRVDMSVGLGVRCGDSVCGWVKVCL